MITTDVPRHRPVSAGGAEPPQVRTPGLAQVPNKSTPWIPGVRFTSFPCNVRPLETPFTSRQFAPWTCHPGALAQGRARTLPFWVLGVLGQAARPLCLSFAACRVTGGANPRGTPQATPPARDPAPDPVQTPARLTTRTGAGARLGVRIPARLRGPDKRCPGAAAPGVGERSAAAGSHRGGGLRCSASRIPVSTPSARPRPPLAPQLTHSAAAATGRAPRTDPAVRLRATRP